jgi:hAT family C-terminal dimerisation region
MASSVSSERAFSAAGITVSKRRNRLKGDIVEALEVLKSLLHQGLIFRHVAFTANIERELDNLEDGFDDEKTYVETVIEAEMFSWDQLVEDDEDKDGIDDSIDGLVIEFN